MVRVDLQEAFGRGYVNQFVEIREVGDLTNAQVLEIAARLIKAAAAGYAEPQQRNIAHAAVVEIVGQVLVARKNVLDPTNVVRDPYAEPPMALFARLRHVETPILALVLAEAVPTVLAVASAFEMPAVVVAAQEIANARPGLPHLADAEAVGV